MPTTTTSLKMLLKLLKTLLEKKILDSKGTWSVFCKKHQFCAYFKKHFKWLFQKTLEVFFQYLITFLLRILF